ncbi:hypothetical protein [Microbacterium soli]|uniref:Uncharacterized protein n=1 Tax=Microbacterium soli TaxID=446075 RepID=A0ABP7MZL5_9MICO
MYVGHGRSTRIAPGTDRHGIRGARFIVRAAPAAALSEGVSALRSARFVPDTTALQATLTASGGPWVAQALTIGRPARRWALTHIDYEYFPLNLLPFLWPRVALTLAIACARATEDGTELIVYAQPSMLRAGERTNDSGPLMVKAAEALQRRFTASGALISHGEVARIDDDGCPASRAFVRQRLGWS